MSKTVNIEYYDIIRRPLMTEKAIIASDALNKYTFEVSASACKSKIKKAIEAIFAVTVSKVNVSNTQGKRKIFKGRPGVRKGQRKAIVTLEQGQKIDFTTGV